MQDLPAAESPDAASPAAEHEERHRRAQRRWRDRSRPSALAWVAGLSLHLAVVLLLA